LSWQTHEHLFELEKQGNLSGIKTIPMIIYLETAEKFCTDVNNNCIEDRIHDAFYRGLGRSVSDSEKRSWRNSMQYMRGVLSDSAIPSDAGVAIEFSIPQTSKRIDFIITGHNTENHRSAVVVELKQWSGVDVTDKNGIVSTFINGGKKETPHPSYQAWSYATMLQDFNEAVRETPIHIKPCAYLHNCPDYSEVKGDFYKDYLTLAPTFTKGETQALRDFISKHLKKGDKGEAMFVIEKGRICPSKNLADSLIGLLKGNREFILVDDQKLVYETALNLAERSRRGQKNVLIVKGGPGTGKSVVAVNLLVELIKRKLVAQYVSKNSAPREVYKAKLTGTLSKSRYDKLFTGSGGYHEVPPNTYDTLIVDEAHRLNEKSGLYANLGENQIKEITQAAKCTIFFIDENQQVHFKDIGRVDAIRRWASATAAEVSELELASQFRCNGSDGYLAWLDNTLGVRPTANPTLEAVNYTFRVFDSPQELRDEIFGRNAEQNRARMVAGYCWKWVSKKQKNLWDFEFPEYNFQARWNLSVDGSLWILKPDSVSEIGCIHTCQGLEVDYVGVIIGPDFLVRNGQIVTNAARRAPSDKSVTGYKRLLKSNPAEAKKRGDEIIKNTYRTLMTRGQRGCFIWSPDPETREYFRTAVGHQQSVARAAVVTVTKQEPLPFALLPDHERDFFVNCIPVFSELRIAAGSWGEECAGFSQSLEAADSWIPLPKGVRSGQRAFVARIHGDSMSPIAPGGSWCLFGPPPEGARHGKNLLVWHASIQDPEGLGQYTLKRWQSVKHVSSDESQEAWQHTTIFLEPVNPAYERIHIAPEEVDSVRVVAELLRVL
jgi:uncharacterized protein